MRLLSRLILPAALLLGLAACSDEEPAPPPQAREEAPAPPPVPEPVQEAPRQGVVTATGPVMDANMKEIVQRFATGPHRDPKHSARDPYRHPVETLEFFGLQQGMRVIEVTPGSGYYTELLAPLFRNTGQYVAALAEGGDDRAQANRQYEAKLRASPKYYGRTEVLKFDPAQPVFGPPASADMVLTFRNAHNWIEAGTAANYFKAMSNVLKPGGVLGLTDHRAAEGEPTDGAKGYVTEDQVIQLAAQAGLVLADRSDINANPRDTKDYQDGVWTLPPTLVQGDVDRARYVGIGESDRMTLKFIKQ